ncbi:MAG: hypothetical protein IKE43_09135 [Coriobacteriales bacterium]|nr:hypothetical protein [Coriobacteriales bacterium]
MEIKQLGRYTAFGFLLFLYFSLFSIAPQLGPEGILSPTNPTLFLAALLIAAVITFVVYLVITYQHKSCKISIPLCLIFAAIGYTLALLHIFGVVENHLQAIIAGAFLGIAISLLLVAWAQAFSCLRLHNLLAASASASILAFFLIGLFEFLPGDILQIAEPVAFLLAALPLIKHTSAESILPGSFNRTTLRMIGSELWLVLIGMTLCQMVDAFGWGDVLAGSFIPPDTGTKVIMAFGAVCGACLVLWWTVYDEKRGTSRIARTNVWLMAIAAGLLLAGWVFRTTNSTTTLLFTFLTGCGKGMLVALFWYAVCSTQAEDGATLAPLASCIAWILLMIVALLGIALPPLIGTGIGNLFIPLTAILFLVLAAVTAATESSAREDATDVMLNAVQPQAPSAEELLGHLGAEHGLTPREQEVMALLALGHSMTYTAERCYISPATVKTHAKHIYTKLGVHTRDELIALSATYLEEHAEKN